MSSAKQNQYIARLIVGAMSIDGSLSKSEQQKVAKTLEMLGMSELIAYVGVAIDEDQGDFNMYEECKNLVESLGSDATELAPLVFRMIADVIASDRFVSSQEALYLSAVARRLKLSTEQSQTMLKQVMAERRGRLEVAGKDIDEFINPQLKKLLSFTGAEELVGEVAEDSLEEMLYQAKDAMAKGSEYSTDDVERALAVLGLYRGANLDEAEKIWKDTIDTLNLPKMANLGETFVTAAINRITRINDAYKTILHFHEHMDETQKSSNKAERLEKEIERAKKPSTRDDLAEDLEEKLTGVGVPKPDVDESV